MKHLPGFTDVFMSPISGRITIHSLPDLTHKYIWRGDEDNRPEEVIRIGLYNAPALLSPFLVDPTSGAAVNFGLYNIYTGGLNLDILEPIAPTTTLRVDMSNMPNLKVGQIWIGKAVYTPPTITIDGTPPYVHVTGSLNWDGRAGLPPFPPIFDPNDYGVPFAVDNIEINNLPNLDFKKIWMGDILDRPTITGLGRNLIFIGKADGSGQIVEGGLSARKIFIGKEDGSFEIQEVGLNTGHIFIGKPDGSGEIIERGLDKGQIFIGNPDDSSEIISTGLSARKIFMGNPDNSLEILETGLGNGLIFRGSHDGSGQMLPAGLPAGQLFIGKADDSASIYYTGEDGEGLRAGKFFIGAMDDSGAVEQTDVIPIGALPDLDERKVWMGDATNRPVITGLPAGKIFIGSYLDDGKIFPIGLSNNHIFIGTADEWIVETTLDAGKMFYGALDGSGISVTGLPAGQAFMGKADGSNKIIISGSGGGDGLRAGKLFLGNADDAGGLTQVTVLPINNMANLTNNKFWRGDATNRPVEVTMTGSGGVSVTHGAGNTNVSGQALQDQIDEINTEIDLINTEIDAINAHLTEIDASITAIEADILALQGQVAALEAAVAAIEAEIAALTATVSTISAALTALTAVVTVLSGQVNVLAAQINAPIIGIGPRLDYLEGHLIGLAGLADAGDVGIVVVTGVDTYATRTLIDGNAIDITNDNGVAGDITISVADNPVIPGDSGLTLPAGATIDRAGGAGTIRFNTSTSFFEGTPDGSSWVTFNTAGGTVTSVGTGTGLTGGPITTSGTISIANTGVSAGSYTNANITVNAQGQITTASNGAAGTVTSVNISTSSSGVTVGGGPITSSGTLTVNINAELQALSSLSSNGYVVRTGTATYANRSITGTSNQITVSNGGGVSANTNVAIANNAIFPGTEGVTLPNGTTAQRPGSPNIGEIRFNTTTNRLEAYY